MPIKADKLTFMEIPRPYFASKLISSQAATAVFSTRQGGKDLAFLLNSLGIGKEEFFTVKQVHNSNFIEISEQDKAIDVASIEADALLTFIPGKVLAVQTADCVPLLLYSPTLGGIAAIHAGWKGIVNGVIQNTLRALRSQGHKQNSEIFASIGPSIGPCCFEVGKEVCDKLVNSVGSYKIVESHSSHERPYIDLKKAVVSILIQNKIRPQQIEMVGPCTRCASSYFYSFRREGLGRGRQYSLIYLNMKQKES